MELKFVEQIAVLHLHTSCSQIYLFIQHIKNKQVVTKVLSDKGENVDQTTKQMNLKTSENNN